MLLHIHEEIIINPPRTGEWHELAEAIRQGCQRVVRQCFDGSLVKRNAHGQIYATCALGAADVAGWYSQPRNDDGPDGQCPVCAYNTRVHELCLIGHLNDDHRWTREAIADWLDTL